MVVREACVANTIKVCLAAGVAMLATACAASRAANRHSRPEPAAAENIRVSYPLRSCVSMMLSRSGTFRRTYDAIARRHDVRVTLALEPRRNRHTRAVTNVRSFAGGNRVADIRLQTTVDVVELIAHELEHVREQIEGTNLLLLSVATTEVRRTGKSFETRRGIETGLQVAQEVGSSASRLCQASVQSAALMTLPY
jgi:hypothetical protein